MIPNWNIELDKKEAKAAYDSIMMRHLSEGEYVEFFEQELAEFLGRKYVICTPSGTCALLLAMMGIGIEPGDEVIVPDLTFIATAHAPKLLGANVVLADTREDLPLIDVEEVLHLITPKTKAVIPVHLNGRSADTVKLKSALTGSGIYVVDDACQAFGSGRSSGYMGKDADIACYSLSVTKIMTTGQGGFLATDSDELYNKMKRLKTHGMGIDGIFESSAYPMAGFNMKYSDILASIGLVQLGKVKQKVANVKRVYGLYAEKLSHISGMELLHTEPDDVIFYPDIVCKNRKFVREHLENVGIHTRPAATCLDKAAYFEKRTDFPHANHFSERMLYLPGGPDQAEGNVERVVEELTKIFSV